jgi:hypothetical protein
MSHRGVLVIVIVIVNAQFPAFRPTWNHDAHPMRFQFLSYIDFRNLVCWLGLRKTLSPPTALRFHSVHASSQFLLHIFLFHLVDSTEYQVILLYKTSRRQSEMMPLL